MNSINYYGASMVSDIIITNHYYWTDGAPVWILMLLDKTTRYTCLCSEASGEGAYKLPPFWRRFVFTILVKLITPLFSNSLSEGY